MCCTTHPVLQPSKNKVLLTVLAACFLIFCDAFSASAATQNSRRQQKRQPEPVASLQEYQMHKEIAAQPDARAGTSSEAANPFVQGAIYTIELPNDILLSQQRADGMDICVYNGDGKTVPFDIRERGKTSSRTVHVIKNMYPLWGKPQSSPDELTLSFALDANSRIIPKISGGQNAPEGQVLKGYVIPLPEEGIRASSLAFDWEKGRESTVQFSLQTSADLRSWHTVVSRASLIRLEGADGLLEVSELDLNGAELGKYVRVIFEPDFAPASVASITVEQWASALQRGAYGPIKAVKKPFVEGKRGAAAQPEALEYSLSAQANSHGGILVDSLQFTGQNPGFYCAASVFTKTSSAAPWRYAGTHTFFTIVRDGAVLNSKPVQLDGRKIEAIKFEPRTPGASLPDELDITLSYIPQDVYFLAQGKEPFRIAWRSEKMGLRDSMGISVLLGQGGDVRRATVSDALLPAASQPVLNEEEDSPRMQYLLWGILGLGVLGLGGMAFSLIKRMRTEQ